MRLVIDTDAGIDDAVALLLALAFPGAEIVAITTVAGNVSLEKVTRNVGVVLDAAGAAAIPVHAGCAKPLRQTPPIHAEEIFGPDGLGGAAVETRRPVQAQHAALALVELARRHPGQLTLLALGPLTNVALAAKLAPDFLSNLSQLVVMGGSVDGRGNYSAVAEFNFAADPEAAAIIFSRFSQLGRELLLLSWETTLGYPVSLADWEAIIAGESAVARLLQKMTAHLKQVMPAPITLWPDPLAAAVALAPEIVQAEESRHIAIECGQSRCRGQTTVDYRWHPARPPNARVVRKIDLPRFLSLLKAMVAGP